MSPESCRKIAKGIGYLFCHSVSQLWIGWQNWDCISVYLAKKQQLSRARRTLPCFPTCQPLWLLKCDWSTFSIFVCVCVFRVTRKEVTNFFNTLIKLGGSAMGNICIGTDGEIHQCGQLNTSLPLKRKQNHMHTQRKWGTQQRRQQLRHRNTAEQHSSSVKKIKFRKLQLRG